MPEIIINGPDGRLEGRYQQGSASDAPVAIVLHPHPLYGGNMNNKLVYIMYNAFANRGFSVLRFNFRGVGRSQGRSQGDSGIGELSDAAYAFDWLQQLVASLDTSLSHAAGLIEIAAFDSGIGELSDAAYAFPSSIGCNS